MRLQGPISALALLAGACAAPAAGSAGAGVGPPPAERAIEVRVVVERDGQPYGEVERVIWRRLEQRIEIPGPGGEEASRISVDLRADFNLAGEFWGRAVASAAGAAGAPVSRVHCELGPDTARRWHFSLPAADAEYRVRIEMDHGFWTKAELARPRFLHRPKYLR